MTDIDMDRLELDGETIQLDGDGHLLDRHRWSEPLAEALARRDQVRLDQRHWWLIRFVQTHFDAYGTPPLMRMTVQAMRHETDCANASSRTLYRLFPDGPIRLACRYAGLPKPESCIE
ncbi:MAG: TusE/DsrC/DsvC family sulfur relay protein [Wenzhouxiangellaceae bacterium]